ncbi:MAG: class I SAM-dependent methyltransferase, partial [Pseudomonadota bacterium]
MSDYIANEQVIERVMEKARIHGAQFLPSDANRITAAGPFTSIDHVLAECETSFRQLVHLTHLDPSSRVLDYGSGIGRMAVPFKFFLSDAGDYVGVDIMKEAVEGCQKRFSGEANFEFRHINLYNKMYNPQGSASCEDLPITLPRSRDVAFMFSIATHLLPGTIEPVMQAVSSALRPGGELLVSFFLLNARVREAIAAGRTTRTFAHTYSDGVCVDVKETPEGAVAYEDSEARAVLEQAGLEIVFTAPGKWSSPGGLPICHQDLI